MENKQEIDFMNQKVDSSNKRIKQTNDQHSKRNSQIHDFWGFKGALTTEDI